MKLDTLDYNSSFVWNGEEIHFNSKSEESIKRVEEYTGMHVYINQNEAALVTDDYVVSDTGLIYVGKSEKPIQPIGLCSYEYLFLEWNGRRLDLSHWDTAGVFKMNGLFAGCLSLEEINISNWIVNDVIDMHEMFSCCKRLKSLNLSKWNVQSVRNMEQMFYECKSLSDLNLDGWNLQNIHVMDSMFCGCKKLNNLDNLSWKLNKNVVIDDMFDECDSLSETTIEQWKSKVFISE